MLVKVDRFFPSSKLCSGCGTINGALALGDRVYSCDRCGLVLDRDANAAINLRRLALAQLPEGFGEVTPVERKALALAVSGVEPASPKQEATQIDEATCRGDRTSVGIAPTRSRAPVALRWACHVRRSR